MEDRNSSHVSSASAEKRSAPETEAGIDESYLKAEKAHEDCT